MLLKDLVKSSVLVYRLCLVEPFRQHRLKPAWGKCWVCSARDSSCSFSWASSSREHSCHPLFFMSPSPFASAGQKLRSEFGLMCMKSAISGLQYQSRGWSSPCVVCLSQRGQRCRSQKCGTSGGGNLLKEKSRKVEQTTLFIKAIAGQKWGIFWGKMINLCFVPLVQFIHELLVDICGFYSHTNSTGGIWALEKWQERVPRGHLTG